MSFSAMVSYRKELGMTQADVACTMGTSRATVSQLEKKLLDGADVSLSKMVRYAAAANRFRKRTPKPLLSWRRTSVSEKEGKSVDHIEGGGDVA